MSKGHEKTDSKSAPYHSSQPSDLVRRFAELAPEGRALDLGVGEGRDVLYLADLGYDVTGVEQVEGKVVKCQKRADEKGYHVNVTCADVRDYRIAQRRYAIIVCVGILPFITKNEAQALVAGITAGLKKGGLFLCQAFTIDDPSYKVHKRKSKEVASGVFVSGTGSIYTLYRYREILELGAALRPIYYHAYDYYDTEHGTPHWHSMVDFVGKKL